MSPTGQGNCRRTPGGITVRFLEAINGFKTKYGYWPTSIQAESATISALATHCLTPLGFFLLQSKVELREGEIGKIIAYGKDRDMFDYGEEGWQSPDGHKHNAREWLGLDED